MPSHSPTPPPIPRPVVLAIVMQLVLTAVDVVSLAFVAFAVIGMTQSSQPPSDPTVDMVMRVSVIGYGIASMVGLSLGLASATGLYRAATWGRTMALVHGLIAIVSCSPCSWMVAGLAIAASLHSDVRAWPAAPSRDLAETFR